MKIIKQKLNIKIDKPYDRIMACVKRDLRISGDAFRLWVTLYTCAETFEPTEASLATQFGVNEKTIYRWIKELRKYGYMTITGSKEGGYFWSIYKSSQGVFNVQADKYDTYY